MDYSQPILAAWAASSSDATKVSRTITGAVVGLTSFIVLLTGLYFHVTVSSGDVLSFGTELGTVGGFIWGVSGFVLKVIHAVAKKSPVTLVPVDAAA